MADDIREQTGQYYPMRRSGTWTPEDPDGERLREHVEDTNNPHKVTAEQVGAATTKALADEIIARRAGDAQTLADAKAYADARMSGVYTFRGSVATRANLPEYPLVGDVYNIIDEGGMNVAWTGEVWDELGAYANLDAYLTKQDANQLYATKSMLTGYGTRYGGNEWNGTQKFVSGCILSEWACVQSTRFSLTEGYGAKTVDIDIYGFRFYSNGHCDTYVPLSSDSLDPNMSNGMLRLRDFCWGDEGFWWDSYNRKIMLCGSFGGGLVGVTGSQCTYLGLEAPQTSRGSGVNIGAYAESPGIAMDVVVVGNCAMARDSYGSAVGNHAWANGRNSLALGHGACASEYSTVVASAGDIFLESTGRNYGFYGPGSILLANGCYSGAHRRAFALGQPNYSSSRPQDPVFLMIAACSHKLLIPFSTFAEWIINQVPGTTYELLTDDDHL